MFAATLTVLTALLVSCQPSTSTVYDDTATGQPSTDDTGVATATTTDGGTTDGGTADGGTADGGTTDGGTTDGGTTDGGTTDGGTSIDPPDLDPGDLVITEIMIDPVKCDDGKGEYFEILNVSGDSIYLRGLTVRNMSTSEVIDDGGWLAAGEYALGRKETAANCYGLSEDFTYNFALSNSGDVLALQAGDVVVDIVAFTSWAIPAGAALSLDPSQTDATLNDAESAWCPSTTRLGGGIDDMGTPLEDNEPCD